MGDYGDGRNMTAGELHHEGERRRLHRLALRLRADISAPAPKPPPKRRTQPAAKSGAELTTPTGANTVDLPHKEDTR